MCMFVCGICCGCCCLINLCEFNHRDFWIRQVYLIIWSIFNYIWFIYLVDVSFWEFLFYVSDYLHLTYILNAILLFLTAKNIFVLLDHSRAVRRHGYRGSDEHDFVGANSLMLILSFIHSPVPEGNFFFCYSLIPVILQLSYNWTRYWRRESLIGIFTLWGICWIARLIGWEAMKDSVFNFITSCGIYFIEYSIVIALSVFVGYQMNKVLDNIENYAELIKTRGKTKKQLALIYLKELFQYALLGFSLIFVYYCESLIEWFHGYSPILISVVTNFAYSYPAATLLKYPIKGNYFNRREISKIANLYSILFSNYLIRSLLLANT